MTSHLSNQNIAPLSTVEHESELNIRDLFSLLSSGRWLVLFFTLGALALAALYLLVASPVYVVDGLIQVEKSSKTSGGALGETVQDLQSAFGSETEAASEIEIIQSRLVLSQVAEELKLEISASPKFFPLIGGAIAKWRKEVDQPAPPLLWMSSYAWGGEIIEVSTLRVPDAILGKVMMLRATDGGGYDLYDPVGNKLLSGHIGLMEHSTYEGAPLEIFVRELRARPGTDFKVRRAPIQQVIDGLRAQLVVSEHGKQSGIVGLNLSGGDPDLAQEILTHVENVYLKQNVERRSAEAQQTLEFLKQQLPDLRHHVEDAQAKLNSYQVKQGSVDITKETELLLQQSVDLEKSRFDLQQQRQQALQRFTPQHPAVLAVDSQLKDIDRDQATIKKRTEALPGTQQEMLGLMRDLEVNTDLYTSVLNTSQQTQVAKAGTLGNVRIVDYPLKPFKPAKPIASIVLAVALLMGLGLGVASVLIKRALLKGVDRPEDVERVLGLPTYASIPVSSSQNAIARALKKGRVVNNLLAAIEGNDIAIEAIRSLRTSLHFALLEAKSNVIVFTGPVPGIGKSFISINLGAVLAMSGKKVIVIDADLRRGHLHKYTGTPATPGLSDYIASDISEDSIVRSTVVNGLDFVSNGVTPPNPAELLLHERFDIIVDKLSKRYDYVLIDTPPILLVADAGIVARVAGCTLLVLRAAEHPMRSIEESVRRLQQAGAVVKGTLFNQIGAKVGSYGYGQYGYGYDYSQKYDSKSR